jgi:hypothetical protein
MCKDRKFRKLAFVALAVTLCSSSSYAATATYSNITVDDNWKFTVAPYLWAINMNGTTQVSNKRAHVDQNFSDILSKMQFGGMLWLDANKGKWGVFLNALYAKLSDDGNKGIVSASADEKFGILGGGASYEVYKTCFNPQSSLAIQPYAGFRYTLNHATVKVSIPGFATQKSNNQNWTDPILGARLIYNLTKAWSLQFAGDLGGTNTSSDYSYNVFGAVGYSPQTFWTSTTTYLGYRILDQHYVTGSGKNYFLWNMKLYGPIIGIAFRF